MERRVPGGRGIFEEESMATTRDRRGKTSRRVRETEGGWDKEACELKARKSLSFQAYWGIGGLSPFRITMV